MFREPTPTPTPTAAQVPAAPRPATPFRLDKLEERIAPTIHTNPQGKTVGDGNTKYVVK